MRRELADKDHAGGFEPRGRFRVRRRHVIEQEARMRGRAQAGGVVDVLQAIGNAVQRTAPPAAGDLALGAPGSGAGTLGGNLDKGVELRLERRSARQSRFGQRDRRQLAGGDLAAGLRKGRQRPGARLTAHRWAPAS
jgi:hypothetical protein